MADGESDKEDVSTASLAAILKSMKMKTPLMKFGRVGKPHYRYFNLSEDRTKLQWISSRKAQDQTEVLVSCMERLVEGQSSEVFLRNKSTTDPAAEELSFTLYYATSSQDGSAVNEKLMKTLDLVCKDKEEYTLWVQGLKWLIAHKLELMEPPEVPVTTAQPSFDPKKTLKPSRSWGELGLTSDVMAVTDVDQPRRVRYFVDANVSDFSALSCGENHMAAVTSSGNCYVWGNSGCGRLGVSCQVGNIFNHALLPTRVDNFLSRELRVLQVACGGYHTLFLTNTQEVFAAGANDAGQLGNGTRIEIKGIVKVALRGSVCCISAGDRSSAAIVSTRSFHIHQSVKERSKNDLIINDFARALFVWGSNNQGCLGIGETHGPWVLDPVQCQSFSGESIFADMTSQAVSPKYSVLSVTMGSYHCAAILECCSKQATDSPLLRYGRRYLATWGRGSSGQLGHGSSLLTNLNSPKIVEYFISQHFEPIQVSCGAAHTVCITRDMTQSVDKHEAFTVHVWGLGIACSSEDISEPRNILEPKIVERSFFTVSESPPGKKSSLDGRPSSTSFSDAPLDSGKTYEVHGPTNVSCGLTFSLITTDEGCFILGRPPIATMKYFLLSGRTVISSAARGQHFAVLARRAWASDEEGINCDSCETVFSSIRRRHHCRNCGGIFCNHCTRKRITLPQLGSEKNVRVCDRCFNSLDTTQDVDAASKSTTKSLRRLSMKVLQSVVDNLSPA